MSNSPVADKSSAGPLPHSEQTLLDDGAQLSKPSGRPVARVIGDAALALLGGVTGRAFLYIAQFLLARWLGPADFGLFALALNVMQLAGVVVGFGLYTACVRYTAIYLQQGSFGRVRSLVKWTTAVVLTSGGLVSLTMIVKPTWWAQVLRESGLVRALPVVGAALPFFALARVFASSLNGLGMARLRSVFESALPSLLFLLGVVALHRTEHLNLTDAGILYTVCWFIVTIASGWILVNQRKTADTDDQDFDKAAVIRFSLPAWGIALLNQLSQRMDIFLAGFLFSGADIGIYSAAALVAVSMTFTMTAFNMGAAPSFAAWHATAEDSALKRLYQDGTRLLLLLGLPLGLTLVLNAEHIMQLLGSEFRVGGAVLTILVIGQIINLGVGTAGNILVMTGRQHLELLLIFGSVILNLGLASWAVPIFGLLGLAFSATISVAMLNVSRLVMVYRHLRIHPYDRSYHKLIVALVVAGIAGVSLRITIDPRVVNPTIVILVVTFAVAIPFLGIIKLLGIEDLERELLAMFRYKLRPTSEDR